MDATEFKAIFMPCQAKMYRTAYAILRNVQDAEDVVQEAYLRLWNKRDDVSIISSKEAYCIMIVKNLCMDFIRNSHVNIEETIDDEHLLLSGNDTADMIEKKEDAARLKRMISCLPEIQKKVMWLRDVNECSFQEIGQATGLNQVNIRVALSKARKKIREQFNTLKERI